MKVYCRKKHARSLLGYLWNQVPKLLLTESERVAEAAATCIGVLGAAIYHSQGASIQQRSKSESTRSQRGRKVSSGPSPSHRPIGLTQLPSAILITWAEGLLRRQAHPEVAQGISDGQRALVLQALQTFLHSCPADLQPSAALHITKTIQALLDSAMTDTSHLDGYLELMLDAVRFMHDADIGKLLPDMLDLFLGWAVDPSSTQASRCGLTPVL